MHTFWINDRIPLHLVTPESQGASSNGKLVVFNPGFSGNRETVAAHLTELAQSGFHAMTMDAIEHGERMIEIKQDLVKRIHTNIRTHFWSILGRTLEDIPAVLDWAAAHLPIDAQRIGWGGISMGGDIALAATAHDPRIQVVTAAVATPDWLRPGTSQAVGHPSEASLGLYERFNPMNHLNAYDHRPAILINVGENDSMVPPHSASTFVRSLRALYAESSDRIELRVHHDTAHRFTDGMWLEHLDWFSKHLIE